MTGEGGTPPDPTPADPAGATRRAVRVRFDDELGDFVREVVDVPADAWEHWDDRVWHRQPPR